MGMVFSSSHGDASGPDSLGLPTGARHVRLLATPITWLHLCVPAVVWTFGQPREEGGNLWGYCVPTWADAPPLSHARAQSSLLGKAARGGKRRLGLWGGGGGVMKTIPSGNRAI